MHKILNEAYVIENWGEKAVFPGDFMNFGYWKNINLNKISQEERNNSAQALYDITTTDLNTLKQGNILEIGFGKGGGLLYLSKKFPYLNFYGIDAVKEHYINLIKKTNNSSFTNIISLYDMPFENFYFENNFDAIIGIEMLQHIKNASLFFKKLNQALRKDGKFMSCAHLSKNKETHKKCLISIPFAKNGIDILLPIDDIKKHSINNGFSVEITPIGAHVFYGFQKWIETIGPDESSSSIYSAYCQSLIDYYLIICTKQ